jgi:predicted alpha/beta hydrolase
MRSRYCSAELTGIAHSIGSLVLGGAKNIGELSRLVFIAPHTGYCGDYAKSVRIPMAAIWHIVIPALIQLFGYFPGRMLQLGEDLPAGMALQWAARIRPDLMPKDENPE